MEVNQMRETINPKMELKQEGAVAEATQTEKASATMPDVGKMPTGMKAAKKEMPE